MTDLHSPEPTSRARQWSRLLVTWLVLPSSLGALLVLFGVHLGAHHPDAWYTRVARFIGSLFA